VSEQEKQYFVVIRRNTIDKINAPIGLGHINFRGRLEIGTFVVLSPEQLLRRISEAEAMTFFKVIQIVQFPSSQKNSDVLILGMLDEQEQKSLAENLSVVPNKTLR